MIYTVTFNPAIDYVVRLNDLKFGSTNRNKSEEIYFGGKGINVSMVLKELGISSKALGFVAGFTGDAIEKEVQKTGIDTDFVHLESGFSRINVKIKAGEETELNGQGPEISKEDLDEFFDKLIEVKDGDTVVLAGSIPGSLPNDVYEQILERLKDRKVQTVVDATGDLLRNVLKYRPFLIKPNKEELGDLFGITIQNVEEIAEYATKLQAMGARNVLVSMAGDGALLIDETGRKYFCPACEGEVRNSVGAGDSVVAGFLAGLQEGDYEYALKLGCAAGSATAFSDGLAKRENIFTLQEIPAK